VRSFWGEPENYEPRPVLFKDTRSPSVAHLLGDVTRSASVPLRSNCAAAQKLWNVFSRTIYVENTGNAARGNREVRLECFLVWATPLRECARHFSS
jgi:hypothetical protein